MKKKSRPVKRPSKKILSRFEKKEEEKRKREKEMVYVRKRVVTPFPTHYLPTMSLKISSIIRYYQMKAEIKKADRLQRKERDIEISKYSALMQYMEKEIEIARTRYIKTQGGTEGILLFKVNHRFDDVLSRAINYLNIQDDVELVSMNENYKKVSKTPPPRMLVVKLNEYMEVQR